MNRSSGDGGGKRERLGRGNSDLDLLMIYAARAAVLCISGIMIIALRAARHLGTMNVHARNNFKGVANRLKSGTCMIYAGACFVLIVFMTTASIGID